MVCHMTNHILFCKKTEIKLSIIIVKVLNYAR
nr:MAG TPA: hypothetical protein [Caudoviricetes sp.]